MSKLNCWQAIGCGREEDGTRTTTHGVCAAALDTTANGINGGLNAGRICWSVAGTECSKASLSGDRHQAVLVCDRCDFYHQVIREEGLQQVQLSRPGQINR